MKVFHGSYDIIKNPLVSVGRDKLDFGKGFYVTDIEEQALKWASKFKALNQKAFVNIYEFDKELASLYKYKSFSIYDEQWLDFIMACRGGDDVFSSYDIIEGGIANDRVFDTIELCLEGLISKDEALGRLKYQKPNNQIFFISQKVLDKTLRFASSYEVKNGK